MTLSNSNLLKKINFFSKTTRQNSKKYCTLPPPPKNLQTAIDNLYLAFYNLIDGDKEFYKLPSQILHFLLRYRSAHRTITMKYLYREFYNVNQIRRIK